MMELDESCRNGVNRAVVWQDDVDVGDLTVSFDVRSIRLSEKYIGGAGVSDGGWGSKIYFGLKCCFMTGCQEANLSIQNRSSGSATKRRLYDKESQGWCKELVYNQSNGEEW